MLDTALILFSSFKPSIKMNGNGILTPINSLELFKKKFHATFHLSIQVPLQIISVNSLIEYGLKSILPKFGVDQVRAVRKIIQHFISYQDS